MCQFTLRLEGGFRRYISPPTRVSGGAWSKHRETHTRTHTHPSRVRNKSPHRWQRLQEKESLRGMFHSLAFLNGTDHRSFYNQPDNYAL